MLRRLSGCAEPLARRRDTRASCGRPGAQVVVHDLLAPVVEEESPSLVQGLDRADESGQKAAARVRGVERPAEPRF